VDNSAAAELDKSLTQRPEPLSSRKRAGIFPAESSMPRPIKPFSARERNLISQTLLERFGHPVALQPVEAELQLNLLKEEFASCPSITWTANGAHFIVFKTGAERFRCQFYYNEAMQFGTGKDEFDNLGDCVVTLLQVQVDQEKESRKIRGAMNSVDFEKANDGEEYFGPLIV